MSKNYLDYYKAGKIILETIWFSKSHPPGNLPYPRLDKVAIIIKPVLKKIVLKR